MSLSITGRACSLQCKYCEGYYLRNMTPAVTPDDLYKISRWVWRRGGYGILVSGGFTREGFLPFHRFLRVLKKIKEEFNLIISIHPGLVKCEEAEMLRDAGVDIVDYEVPPGNYAVRELKGLKKDYIDYLYSLADLMECGPPYIAPHITLGLPGVSQDDELRVLKDVVGLNPYIIVFLAFIPTKGTSLGREPPPSPLRIKEVLRKARNIYNGSLALGCMRPWSLKLSLDPIVIKEGLVDRIVNPPRILVKTLGLNVIPVCCSVPLKLIRDKEIKL